MKRNIFMKIGCVVLSGIILCTSFTQMYAARKAALAAKRLAVKEGQRKKITIRNKKNKALYSYKSSDSKKVSVTKKGIVTGKKAGKAKITVTEKIKKKTKKLGVVQVTVTAVNQPKNTPAPTKTAASTSPTAQVATTPAATAAPLPTAITPVTTTPATTAAPTQTATASTRAPLVIADHDTPAGFDQKQGDTEYGTLSKVTYHSNTTDTDRKANIITPAGYSTDKKYPVLYLFHGGNGDENDWLDGKPEYIIGNLIAAGEAEDMIVVMPNCRARENDAKDPSDSLSLEHMAAWTNFLNDFTDDLMPYIEENYPVLTGRENTAIGGLSMGGREALYLGFSIPDRVSYIGAFSPAFGIFEYENWGLYEEGYFTEDTFTFPDKYMDNTTCLIMNGADDSMVRDEPERYHNALITNQVNHYYYTIPGDHNMTVWKNGLYNYAKLVFK